MADPPIRVLVADDHEIVRVGLRTLLAANDDMELVGEASSAADAVRLALRLAPDVTVLDVHLGAGSGIAATRDIRAAHPDARVLVFTGDSDDEALFAAITAGASGFVLKRAATADLLGAIRQLAAGHSLLDPAVTATVLERLRQSRTTPTDERLARLSTRELEVLTLVSEGRSNHEIAEAIFISEKTVKNHLTRIMTKLGVGRRTEAAAYFNRQAMRFQV